MQRRNKSELLFNKQSGVTNAEQMAAENGPTIFHSSCFLSLHADRRSIASHLSTFNLSNRGVIQASIDRLCGCAIMAPHQNIVVELLQVHVLLGLNAETEVDR